MRTYGIAGVGNGGAANGVAVVLLGLTPGGCVEVCQSRRRHHFSRAFNAGRGEEQVSYLCG